MHSSYFNEKKISSFGIKSQNFDLEDKFDFLSQNFQLISNVEKSKF